MIVFENLNKRHAVVTACKVASTSLVEFFMSTDYLEISHLWKQSQGFVSKKQLMHDFLTKEYCEKFDKFTFVVRDPQKRYYSGVGEVLKRLYFIPDNVIDELGWLPRSLNKNNLKVDHISKTFEQYVFSKMVLENLLNQNSNDYSFGLDPHVSNWLVNMLVPIIEGKEVEVIMLKDLHDWAESNFNRIPATKNLTPTGFKGVMERCICSLKGFTNLHFYLLSEKNIYNWATNEDFKYLSDKEKIKQAKDLLRENLFNKNGFITYLNNTQDLNNILLKNLEKNLM